MFGADTLCRHQTFNELRLFLALVMVQSRSVTSGIFYAQRSDERVYSFSIKPS